jgi:hypothetical protein
MKNFLKYTIFLFFFVVGIYSSFNYLFNKNIVTNLKIKTDYFYFHFESHPLKGKEIRYRLNINKKNRIIIK